MAKYYPRLTEVLVYAGLVKSKSEAGRLIKQGAVRIMRDDGTCQARPRNPQAFVVFGHVPGSEYLGMAVVEVDKSVLKEEPSNDPDPQ